MTRTSIVKNASRHTVVVRFVKRDGSLRRMVCRYDGATSRAAHLLTMWDLEKGAYRTINLDTVIDVRVLQGKRMDRPAVKPSRAAEEMAAISEMF